MCLIAFHWQPNAAIRLVVAGNRDEFYARPTIALHRWADQPIVAGRDLEAGGTWLGIGTGGRVAALTNYRDIAGHRATAPSRGSITSEFLAGHASAADYLETLAQRASVFNPFNLLLFDGTTLLGFESRHTRTVAFAPGTHAVSNADFNTPWPKLMRLRSKVADALGDRPASAVENLDANVHAHLFNLLAQRQTAPDALLPRTGIPVERERALSSEFIQTPDYGTRCSTVAHVGRGFAELTERSFNSSGFGGEVHVRICWEAGR